MYDPAAGSTAETASGLALDQLDPGRTTAWVDFVQPTDDEIADLERRFNLHPLALKATRSSPKYPTPRTEIYDGAVYIRWYSPQPSEKGGMTPGFTPVNIFVDKHYLITIRDEPVGAVDELYKATLTAGLLKDGSVVLLHRLLDAIIDDFFPLLDEISDRVDILEDAMMERPTKDQLRELFDFKHALLTIHKIVSPERETINVLSRFELGFMTSEVQPYFLDIYDHLVQLSDIVDTTRDVIGGAMDVYLSSISNRLNEVMKRLTIVATVFLPLTLITGFFGMNLPFAVNNIAGFLIALAVALVFIGVVVVSNRER